MEEIMMRTQKIPPPLDDASTDNENVRFTIYSLGRPDAHCRCPVCHIWDFSASSLLTSPRTMMLFIMTVCEAVNSMCNTKVVDIPTNLLVSWLHTFMLGHYAGFEIQFELDCLAGVVCAHISLQANIHLNSAHLVEEFAKKPFVLDSLPAAVTQQRGENDNILRQVCSKQQEEINELETNLKDLEIMLEEKNNARRHLKECFGIALELEGQMASESLL